MSGLFGTFGTAKSGMMVQQRNIDTTSHNIANVNTAGYSRQRVKVESARAHTSTVGQIGMGAQVKAIERVRDSFLDYQIRNESSGLGKYDVSNKFLTEVESIFNEPSDTGIASLMGTFFDSWQELSKQANSSNARTVVAQQTESLTNALNSTYTKLEELKENAQHEIKTNVKDLNSLLNQIDSINQEIIGISALGHMPNDLMDKRDLLLDELSYKFNIVVEKDAFNGINVRPADVGGMKVPNIVSASPNGDVSRFSYISSINPMPGKDDTYEITYYKNGDTSKESNKQSIIVSGVSKEQLEEMERTRVLWSDKDGQAVRGDGFPIKNGETINVSEAMFFKPQTGSMSGLGNIQKDLNNYMSQLNKLAKSMAFAVNTIHSGMTDPFNTTGNPDRDYTPFFVNSDVAKYGSNGQLLNLEEVLHGESEITAKNISINKELLNDVMKIKTKTNDWQFDYAGKNDIDGEADGARALAIAQLQNTILNIQGINESIFTRADMFDLSKGGVMLQNSSMTIQNFSAGTKIDAYYKDTIDRLAVQAQEAGRMVVNQEELLYSLENSKAQVSAVSLDEEMANLVQFQHAYNASAKIIATVDELLDVVVNGLKR